MSRSPDSPSSRHGIVDVPELVAPRGYSHGTLAARSGRPLAVAGQIGWDGDGELVGDDFESQFEQALTNVVAVVAAAGATPGDILRLRIYVVDREEYRAARPEVGDAYRRIMGDHYPAMTLVEVAGLLEPGAVVEIEADASVPDRDESPRLKSVRRA